MTRVLRVLSRRVTTLPRSRAFSSLGDTLKVKERAEERLFATRMEQQQLDEIRKAREQALRLRQQAEHDFKFNAAMMDLEKIPGSDRLGPELKRTLADWKAFGL